MRDNQHVRPVIDVAGEMVMFEIKGQPSLVLELKRLHPDVIKRAALAGMAQVRIVDAAAVGMQDDDGNIIPEPERIKIKYERMAALVAHYHTGTAEWNLPRGAGGGGGGRSATIEAIANVRGLSYDDAKASVERHAAEKYGGNVKKCLAFLRTGARVQAEMARIRAERSGPGRIDADAEVDKIG